jgi:hypothetical protein
MRIPVFVAVVILSFAVSSHAQDRPATTLPADAARVFVTDSESWSIAGQSGGTGGSYGGTMAGGARPQTAEIIKTFGERCPEVRSITSRREPTTLLSSITKAEKVF